VATGAVVAMLIAAGLGATGFARGWTALGIGGLSAYAVLHFVPGALWWMVALGMSMHIAEDMCTGHGVTLLWPVYRKRIGGDGRQPAKSRQPARTRPAGQRPGSHRPAGRPAQDDDGWQGADFGPGLPRAAAGRPAPAGKTGPYRTGKYKPGRLAHAMDWVQQCGDCLDGTHGECRDRGCKCARGEHPKRPGGPAAPHPTLPDEPPF